MTDPRPASRPPDIGRRTLTPFGYAVCVVVPVLIAALGLLVLHLTYDEEDLVSGRRIAILTADRQPGGATALLRGTVTLAPDGCVVIIAANGTTVTPVWPADFAATVERVGAADQVKVYDVDRDVVARSGQTVEFGGASVAAADYAGRPCAPPAGEVVVMAPDTLVVQAS